MRLVTFEDDRQRLQVGALAGEDRIADLRAACALYLREVEHEAAYSALAEVRVPPDMRAFFAGGDRSLETASAALRYVQSKLSPVTGSGGERVFFPREAVRLKAPIIPKKFFHTAGNFGEHRTEAARPWVVFFQNVDAVIGDADPVIYPGHLTQELDYELELAVVIKKAGKHFSAEDARDYIGGYLIFNDITARDIQRQEKKSGVFSFCKAIDTFCPLGPWIVTADEIPDPHNLAMELRVNGEPRQRSHSSKMSVTIPEIIAHYSPMGYSAGDVVSTGSIPSAPAAGADPRAWYLKPGDVVECEIENIGVLRNPVISWEQAYGKVKSEKSEKW